MTTDIDYESPAVRAQLDAMEASLERAEQARSTGTGCLRSLTGAGSSVTTPF